MYYFLNRLYGQTLIKPFAIVDYLKKMMMIAVW